VALIPVALVAWTRSRGAARARSVSVALAGAVVVADVAIVLPVALWLAVLLLLVAVRRSRRDSGLEPVLETVPAPPSSPGLAIGRTSAEAVSPSSEGAP
jgi:hypothetical protein